VTTHEPSQNPSVHVLHAAVELPKHSDVSDWLDYSSESLVAPGCLLRVPLGRRVVRAIAWGAVELSDPDGSVDSVASVDPGGAVGAASLLEFHQPGQVARPAHKVTVKPILSAATFLPPLSDAWRSLLQFAASYYQRGLGELALSTLPPQLRTMDDAQLERALRKLQPPVPKTALRARRKAAVVGAGAASNQVAEVGDGVAEAGIDTITARSAPELPNLTLEQQQALQAIHQHPGTTLLYGVTGSGKTEVYLRATEAALNAGHQVLVMVPEINLTPQLEARFAARFATHRMATLHSGLTPAQRLQHWLAAHLGQARLVLGTRLAVFASMPHLGLIIVDEEHDPSFKQQEGARYSARDLAVYRGQNEGVRVVLGSATPSLESWKRADEGRYQKVLMRERIGAGVLPRVCVVDMTKVPREVQHAMPLAPPLLDALRECLARGEQSLVLLNRRGYTPVMHCTSCGWKSDCAHCSAWRVFHKADRTLRCHHCGWTTRVPKACPSCGDIDIGGIGRGTQKLEEQLALAIPNARVVRIDADTVRRKGELQAQLAAVHDGDVDILVGTQMVAKGHDFRRITLVAAVDPDGALFTSDFRAPERLFALLMQAAGRAGRDAAQAAHSTMWVQTWHPQHAIFAALRKHDFDAFAASQLAERQQAAMPPYSSLALLRADAKTAAIAEAFLRDAALAAQALVTGQGITVYPPVPLSVARVADVERMQMLIESPQRAALQRLLTQWQSALHALRAQHKGVTRFAIDVDPLTI
jgi:primosomal protein N' (replication factor Y) (superfamily II helicase)